MRDSDALWHRFYSFRFGDEKRLTSSDEEEWGQSRKKRSSWRESYWRRLEQPQPDDCVEVSWHGKFNLSLGTDSRTVRAGCSWWAARVVLVVEPFYKVSYPGWSSSWDEWVKRSRVRWPAVEFRSAKAKKGEDVEICFRPESWQTRPPVWLEARIVRARKSRLLIMPLPAQTKNKKFWIDSDKVCASRTNRRDDDDDDSFKCLRPRYRQAIALSERIRIVLLNAVTI